MKRSLFLSLAAGLLASLAFGTPSHAGSITYTPSGGGSVTATPYDGGSATATVSHGTHGTFIAPGTVTIGSYFISATGTGFTFTPPNNFTFSGGEFTGQSETLAVLLTPTSGPSATVDVQVSFNGFAYAGNTSGVAVSAVVTTPDMITLGDPEYMVTASTNTSLHTITLTLSPAPEPSTMCLLGIGMAGFFTYRRLFKRRAVGA
jgi:hypothetical protein